MATYRGSGGSTSTTDQATIDQVAEDAATATTKAAEAATSAAEAASSASSANTARGSAVAASGSAQNSANSAEDSKDAALAYKNQAFEYKNNAEDARDAAIGAETNASTSAASATTSAANAASSATTAATSESNAEDFASDAQKSAYGAEDVLQTLSDSSTLYSARHYAAKTAADAATAEAARIAAEAAQESIDGTYLGALSSDPTVDGNGDAVTVGDWYFNSTSNLPKIYDGSAWNTIDPSLAGDSSPQLGGDLDSNGYNIEIDNANYLRVWENDYNVNGSYVRIANDEIVFGQKSSPIMGIPTSSAMTFDGLTFESTVGLFGPDTYFQLDRNNCDVRFFEDTGTTVKLEWQGDTEQLEFADNAKATFGESDDLQIFHYNNQNFINSANNMGLYFYNDLVSFNSQDGTYETLVLDNANNKVVVNTNMEFGDNDKAVFGAGSDLQIYHDGTHSYLSDVGNGNFYITSDGAAIALTNADKSEFYAVFNNNGASELRYDNSAKLATTSTGIDVTGTVTADGLTVDGGYKSIGIGAASPNTNTIVSEYYAKASSGDGVARSYYTTSGGEVVGEVGISNYALANNLFIQTTTASDIKLVTNSSERMRITSGGNVGIGTSNPSTALDVNGTVTADGLTVDGNPVLNNVAPRLFFQTGATHYNWQIAAQENVDAGFEIGSGSQDAGATNDTYTKHLVIEQSGDISFYEDTGTTAKFFWDASAESLGIGTSSPSAKLHTAGGNQLLQLGTTNTSSTMNANATNSVIGVTAPFGENPATTSNAGAKWGMTFTGNGDALTTVGGTKSASVFAVSEDNLGYNRKVGLSFYTSSMDANQAERMRIDSSGNVGIGTSSPSQALHIKTTADESKYLFIQNDSTSMYAGVSASGFATIQTDDELTFNAGGYAERMRIDSSGNLLVGATTTTNMSDGTGNDGVALNPAGTLVGARTSNVSLVLNRLSTDGAIANFNKDGTSVGSIGVDFTDNLFISGNTSHAGINFGTSTFTPYKNGDTADASLDIGSSAGRWKDLYLSGGVYLGGTGSANHLDDYEEGTWTPVARGRTSSGTGTYTRQSGYYTKVGKLVTANIDIGWSAHTGTGGLEISLPFTVSGTGYQGGAYLTYNSGLSYSYNMIHGWMDNGGSYLRVWQTNTSGASTNVPMDTSVSELHFTVVYTATD